MLCSLTSNNYLRNSGMELVFEFELIQIRYEPENKLLILSWENYLTSEDYIKLVRELLRLTDELKIEKWLIDARHADQVQRGNLDWNINFVGSSLAKTRLRKIARLKSDMIDFEKEAKHLLNKINEVYGLGLEINFFREEDLALDWLLEKDSTLKDELIS
jgi:hypothetical protein